MLTESKKWWGWLFSDSVRSRRCENVDPVFRCLRLLPLLKCTGKGRGRFEFFPLQVPFYFLNLFLFLKFCFPFRFSLFFPNIFVFFYLWFQTRPRWIPFIFKHSCVYSMVSRDRAEHIFLYISVLGCCIPRVRYLTILLKITCISA